MQVVVLDDVRIRRFHPRHQPADQIGLPVIPIAARLQHFCPAQMVAHRDHEDAIALGIEPGSLQIELHAVQLVEGEVAEIGSPGRDQVLLLRRQGQYSVLAQLAQLADGPPEPPRCALQNRRRQRSRIGRGDKIA